MLVPISSFLVKNKGPLNNPDDVRFGWKFKPRNDCEAMLIRFPIDWESKDRMKDRNWRMALQGWTFFESIIFHYDSYKEQNIAIDFFIEVCRSWWDSYGSDRDDIITTRNPNSYAWYDMSVGYRALYIAFFANRIDEGGNLSINIKDKELIDKIIKKHVNHLKNPEVFSLNNHGIVQIHGLMALCKVRSADNIEVISYAKKQMQKLIASQFDEGCGIHLENSPQYHFYALKQFKDVIDSDWYDENSLISKTLILAEEKSVWLVDPSKRTVCIGDSTPSVQNLDFSVVAEGKPSRSNEYVTSDFDQVGYAIVRSNWKENLNNSSMLFVAAMYHNKSHKHRDCMSFEWFDRGMKIICDAGKYAYKSDIYRKYFLSAKGHNSVEIDGFDILNHPPYGSGILLVEEVDESIFHIKCKIKNIEIDHVRRFIYSPCRWLIIIDELQLDGERQIWNWYHFPIGAKLVGKNTNSVDLDVTGNIVNIEIISDGQHLGVYCGDYDIMQGFVSEKNSEVHEAICVGAHGIATKNKKITTLISLDSASKINALNFISNNNLI